MRSRRRSKQPAPADGWCKTRGANYSIKSDETHADQTSARCAMDTDSWGGHLPSGCGSTIGLIATLWTRWCLRDTARRALTDHCQCVSATHFPIL